MRNLVALAVFLVLGTAAQAIPAPVELQPIAVSPDDLTIAAGPAGASLERDYFRAPQTPYAAGRVFPCSLQLRVFDKTRLAQSCN